MHFSDSRNSEIGEMTLGKKLAREWEAESDAAYIPQQLEFRLRQKTSIALCR